jgi:hypothetical protein
MDLLTLQADSDGDGLPDGWEINNGLNPDLADAGQDPDRDGFTNLEEYQGGSSPQNDEDAPANVKEPKLLCRQARHTISLPEIRDEKNYLLPQYYNSSWEFMRGDNWTDLKPAKKFDGTPDFSAMKPEFPALGSSTEWCYYDAINNTAKGRVGFRPPDMGGITTLLHQEVYLRAPARPVAWQQPYLLTITGSRKLRQTTDGAPDDSILDYPVVYQSGVFEFGPRKSLSTNKVLLEPKFTLKPADFPLLSPPNYRGAGTAGGYEETCWKLTFVPLGITAFKRGTLNMPGAEVPTGTGEFGYETVMMENADSESSLWSETRDCDESGTSLTLYRKLFDDDLVKIVLKWPVGIKPAGASLKLLHDGMQVDAKETTADAAVSTSGASRLNFYKADGKRITNPTTDLQIPDLANPPIDRYLSKIVTDGEVTIFIEGADRFGDLPVDRMTRLGGALLKWEFKQGTTEATEKLLVYRGGFLRFLQPADAPGTEGTFEFRDGKGRIRNRNDGYHREFAQDDTDLGNVLLSWSAKSGKTVATGANLDYRIGNGKGHTPPGWWTVTENALATTERQTHRDSKKVTHAGQTNETWEQADFCRWQQDDPTSHYSTAWEYHADKAQDAGIGRPTFIEYKFRLSPIAPTNPYQRNGLLIHPDGKRNGTSGCIGVQNYVQCVQVRDTLRNYHSLKIKVQRQ